MKTGLRLRLLHSSQQAKPRNDVLHSLFAWKP